MWIQMQMHYVDYYADYYADEMWKPHRFRKIKIIFHVCKANAASLKRTRALFLIFWSKTL